jgi:hypothetical protein
MTSGEQVTDFKLEGAPVTKLLAALTKYCKKAGVEPDEYGFTPTIRQETQTLPSATEMRWLIAFAVEGANEGYYVHVGYITSIHQDARFNGTCPTCGQHFCGYEYIDFGFAKTFSTESAYTLAREAQRFLTAAAWN